MKRILFTTLLILSFIGLKTYAHDFEVNGVYYNIVADKKVEVTFKGEDTDSHANEYIGSIKIPSSVSYYGTKYTVIAIGNDAFYDCEKITSVKIPNSVIAIGNYAFYGCKKATSIEIPKSITNIGRSAFMFTNLYSIKIPKSVINIGVGAFNSCDKLTTIIVEKGNRKYDSRDNCNAIIETASNKLIAGCLNTIIPNSVNEIGENAFWGVSGLTSISIPSSVTSIGDRAFFSCDFTSIIIPNTVLYIGKHAFEYTGLTRIKIPKSVAMIGVGAFESCSSLESIIVEKGNDRYDSRDNCNAIIETASNKLIAGCRNTKIPNAVTEIGEYAFDGQYYLPSIIIPNSVKKIGENAFWYCTKLTSITIPYSVTEIQKNAFGGCENLEEVTILNADTKYHPEAFDKNTKIIRSTK